MFGQKSCHKKCLVEPAYSQSFDGYRNRDESIHRGHGKVQQKVCERACEPFHPEELEKMNGFRDAPE